ncbi:glycosyltransferase family 2 protein [Falsarthrobacter nasiphocae]|uniref:Galactosyltransferase C-terminal domain-containing protein n=1 Tax=Falsarthrobacter nasiphocae TaxID=189863 RepID=A0AAE3YE47_9MICC|nr:galactosyltransferase-related protein [Falsarthrobacter nasiphocae]MDR6891525.1 hypothetical protein [Falsarthrobacter nasiphocae]
MKIAVVTIASQDRADRVRRQHEGLAASAGIEGDEVLPVVVDLADPRITPHAHADGTPGRVPLAAARNLGARTAAEAGADLVVFLDADCIPGTDLLARYRDAASARPDALLAGPVTYLTEDETRLPLESLRRAVHPHAARPNPPAGTLVTVGAREENRQGYTLFWSLSFAATPAVYERVGGFYEGYQGYGGEDTDFGFLALAAGVDLVWVGGAHAFHQWHPVSSPPVEHLADILVNARIFHARWGVWPMVGWLEAFEATGLARRDDAGWHLAGSAGAADDAPGG